MNSSEAHPLHVNGWALQTSMTSSYIKHQSLQAKFKTNYMYVHVHVFLFISYTLQHLTDQGSMLLYNLGLTYRQLQTK